MYAKTEPIVLTLFGPFACWSRPECKVERLSYPVPTPSGIRGILNAIYCKPEEFFWQVETIEVLSPIEYIGLKTNEVIRKMPRIKEDGDISSYNGINIEEDRTQRQTMALKNVKYRVTAHMELQPTTQVNTQRVYEQAKRRIERGQTFFQPSFGLREFECYFELGSDKQPPIQETKDLGLMVYDTFDPRHLQSSTTVSLFHAKMENGVIHVPPYDSKQVLKSKG